MRLRRTTAVLGVVGYLVVGFVALTPSSARPVGADLAVRADAVAPDQPAQAQQRAAAEEPLALRVDRVRTPWLLAAIAASTWALFALRRRNTASRRPSAGWWRWTVAPAAPRGPPALIAV